MKIGTVGTNFIVSSFIEAVRETGRAEIAAVYSRSAQNAAAFAEKHAVPRSFSSRADFLNGRDLDFIYVAAPNALHYEWTRDALRAGRNVICEKPFVSRAGELRELISLAREGGLFLFEAVTVPHLPNFKRMKELLPSIAPLRMVQLNFSQYSSRYDAYLAGENPNVFNPAFSGGALMDLNYYNLRFCLDLFGGPDGLSYFPNRGPNGIDTSGVLVLKYPGFTAAAAACKDSAGQNGVQIQGERGSMAAPSSCGALREGFTLYTRDSSPNSSPRSFNEQNRSNVLFYELLDFIETFERGDRDGCEAALEESLRAAVYLERARKDAGIFFPADGADTAS